MAGVCGGLFVVPINAALQEIGHKSIGSGGAVAIQNFFENLAMLLASGIYAVVAGIGVNPVITMIWLGLLVMVATAIVSCICHGILVSCWMNKNRRKFL